MQKFDQNVQSKVIQLIFFFCSIFIPHRDNMKLLTEWHQSMNTQHRNISTTTLAMSIFQIVLCQQFDKRHKMI